MATSELVEQYTELVEKYDVLRERISKAEELRGRFKDNVVERVLGDYETQRLALEAELAPCEDRMFVLTAEREAEQAQVAKERSALEERKDEIELRHMIGEFQSGEYEALAEQGAADMEKVLERLEALETELSHYRGLLSRAGAEERREARLVASSMPVMPVEEERTSAQPEPVAPLAAPVLPPPAAPAAPPAPPASKAAAPSPAAPPAAPAALPEPPAAPSAHAFGAIASAPEMPLQGQLYEMAPLLDTQDDSDLPVVPTLDAGGEGGSAFDMILDDFHINADPGLSPLPDAAVDPLGGLTELDQDWPSAFPSGGDFQDALGSSSSNNFRDDFKGLTFGEQDELPPLGMSTGATPRSAFLTRQFGRPDEDRYEIQDDVTSIGRGRDNQIQIKDDTKVSRYHCRILREPDGFYVEDNNSSNGTLVNGEQITRRKVDGDEDVTIGETVFRFELR